METPKLSSSQRLPSADARRRIGGNEVRGVGGLLAAPGDSLWDFHPKLEAAPSRRAQLGASREIVARADAVAVVRLLQ